jgi:hypothetical protein
MAEQILQVLDAGRDELGVVQVGVGPRVRTPPWTYSVWSGDSEVGDQPRLPVMPTELKERPW